MDSFNIAVDCVFCDIVAEKSEASFVYQDELVSAFMDIQPINTGHVLIVPNRHAEYVNQLDNETGNRLFQLARKMNTVLRCSGLRCEGVNFFLADGRAAGQEIFHVHIHVIPRYEGDGHRWEMAQHYHDLPTRSELEATADALRKII